MKFFTYIDIGLTRFFAWQFSHFYIAIPMILIEFFIFVYLWAKFRRIDA